MAQDLTDIDGLGSRNAQKLKNSGIKTIEDLAECDPKEVADGASNLSANRVRGFKNEAKRSAVTIMTGEDVAREYDELTRVSTGVDYIDEMLGGGWESGFLVALAGETGSGKTQLSFQALGEAVSQHDKPAVYIETERGRYRGNRIREMYDEDIQEMVYKIPAYSLDQQEMAYEKVKEEFGPNEISCVVVDSFTARFRMSDQFTGREDLPDRHTVMARHLDKLDGVADVGDVPVLLTCQVSSNPDQYGGAYSVYGGTLMHHMVNFVFMMKARQGALSEIELRNHPEVEDQEFGIQIVEDGVTTP